MDRPDPRQTIEEVLKNLSKEDKQELRNCQRNGFLVGAFWGLTVQGLRQLAVQYNKMKKPTVGGNVGTFLVNLVLGYIAYTPICASKAIEPLVKKKLGLGTQEGPFQADLPLSIDDNTSFQSPLQSDLDGPDPNFSHLSISYDGNPADNLILLDEEETVKPKVTTYEDLRRQNRETYRVKNFAPEAPKPPSQPIREPPIHVEPPKRVKTNQYGDPLE